jgi:hypothetical protein
MFFAGESLLLDELRPPRNEDPSAGVRSIGEVLGELLARYQPLDVGTRIGAGGGDCGGAGA